MKKLERRLGLGSVIAISMSAMLGSGLFVLPGLAAAKTGPSVWLAYLVAGLCVLPAALSKAELGTAMPTSGGTYVYVDRAFGPLAGTVAGLGLWVSLLLKSAFALVGFTAYLVVFADVDIKPTALILLLGITLLNIRGVKGVSRVQVIVVSMSVVGLLVLAALALPEFESRRLESAFPEGSLGFLGAVGFVFVSFAGVTKVAAIAEEVKNPSRNLPGGILLSLLIASLLYSLVALVLVGTIPLDVFQADQHPVYTLATVGSSLPVVAILAAILGVVTMTSMANAGLLAASRFPFAMSRDRLLPSLFNELHGIYITPLWSIISSSLLMALAIWFLDIEKIAKLASAFMIILFVVVNLAVLILRETNVQWYQPQFRSPLYPWVQLFGVVSGLALLTVMGPLALFAIVAIALPGVALYYGYARPRTDRLGVVVKRGRRTHILSKEQPAVREPTLSGDASVVVALFGDERSPEMLVEIGAALAEERNMQVHYLSELPEQLSFSAISDDDPKIASVKRRVQAMAEAEGLALDFQSSPCRDLGKSVYDITNSVHSEWLVLEWFGHRRGSFTITNPIGWLIDHLKCNTAIFYDAGVRYIRKIAVLVEPGPHDALVLGTADHLAELHDAEITFARFVPTTAGDTEKQAVASYLDQLCELSGAPSSSLVLIGRREKDVLGTILASHDLVITEAVPVGSFVSRIRGTSLDQLIQEYACSALRLGTPREKTHATFERYKPKSSPEIRLLNLVRPRCAIANIDATKKDALFQSFADAFAAEITDVDPAAIVASLWERERTQSTALGDGIALPHATLVAAGQTQFGVFTTADPVDYQAPDGKGVDVFFVTLGTPADRTEHLQLLSMIAKMVLKSDVLTRLRAATTGDEIKSIILDSSRSLDQL